jgi:methylated-DNA-[protein]-cysteine S-methyltransferase
MALRFAQLETDLGPMLAAWTDAGVAALQRGHDLEPFLASLRRRFRGAPMEPAPPPIEVVRQLDEYARGHRRRLELDLDRTGVADFDARVYAATRAVPYGETATYGEIARRIGRAGAARAVGGAMGRCPFSPVVPCHRVVRAADGFSGWGGDLSEKRWLLSLERSNSRQVSSARDERPSTRPDSHGV